MLLAPSCVRRGRVVAAEERPAGHVAPQPAAVVREEDAKVGQAERRLEAAGDEAREGGEEDHAGGDAEAEGADGGEDNVDITGAVTVEVAFATADAVDDAVKRVLGSVVPDPFRAIRVAGGCIMAAALTDVVLMAVANILTPCSPAESYRAS